MNKNRVNRLLLLSGNDIPLPEAGLLIHPPKLKEIAMVGETDFFSGVEFLKISKKNLEMDKNKLEKITDFDILMKVMSDKTEPFKEIRENAYLVLFLLFPNYTINFNFNKQQIEFLIEDKEIKILNNKNYQYFTDKLRVMFPLKDENQGYNPGGDLAKKIAQKLEKRQQRLAELKQEHFEINILNQYASILAIGLKIDINIIMNYTVYQLLDEWKRYNLKSVYETTLQAKMAGCQDVPEAESWMEDFYTNIRNF